MIAVAVGLTMALQVLQGGEQGKPAPEAPSAFVEPQDTDRPGLPASDLKSLRETNIFSPKRVVRKGQDAKGRSPGGSSDLPRTPKPPLVTGITFDPVAKQYQVILEDRNTEKLRLLTEPKFLKAGDQVLVYTIDSVEAEKVIVSAGGTKKELRVGEALPDVGLKAPETADASSEEEGDPGPGEAKSELRGDGKPEPKAEGKPDSKRSDASGNSSSSMDEETRKKVLEERMKRLGKKRSE